MIKTISLLLLSLPAFAALTTSGTGTIAADGVTVTINMNDASLSGSPTGCFSFTGNIESTVYNTRFTPTSITLTGGAGVQVVSGYPLFKSSGGTAYTTSVVVAASGTCALTGGTVGNTGSGSTSSALTNNSEWYPGCDVHYSGNLRYQGGSGCGTDGNGYPSTPSWISTTGGIDIPVTSTTGTISVFTVTYPENGMTLRIDGAISSRQTYAPISGNYGPVVTWSGLDTGAHTFTLTFTDSNSQYFGLQGLRVSGASYSGALPAARPIITACGASYVNLNGGGGATYNIDDSDFGLLYQALGVITQGTSYAGQPLYTTLRGSCPGGSMTPANGTSPVLGFMEPDTNDWTSVSFANVQAASQTVVTNIMAAAHPPARLFFLQPFLVFGGGSGSCSALTDAQCAATYGAAYAAGVAAAANANTTFIPTTALASGAPPWMDNVTNPAPCGDSSARYPGSPTLTSGGDKLNLHPCPGTVFGDTGFGKLANRMAPIVAGIVSGVSFTVSGPSTGTTGSPSTTFTVSLCGTVTACLFEDPITVTSTNGGDQICIIGGACGVGSVAGGSGLGAHAFGFTIQAVSAGARTINWSGLAAGWVPPSGLTYTASGTAAGSPPSTGFPFLIAKVFRRKR
jgi:hypothetical protein